jgi:hypothetical protein
VQRGGWAERCLYVLAAVAFALGTHARIVPAWDTVFRPSGEVFLLDSDSYYHLRRTEFAVEHFPRVQRWDVGTNYPVGERSPHAGLFHVLLAGVCLVFGGTSPSRDLIAWVLAVSPVLLYLIAALFLFPFAVDVETCRRCGGRLRLLAVITHLTQVARFLHHRREPTEPPARAPPRDPPYFKTLVVRRRQPTETSTQRELFEEH